MRDVLFAAIEAERGRIRAGQKPVRSVDGLFDTLHERMSTALAARLGDPAAAGDEFRALDFQSMVASLLRARGVAWGTRADLIERGINTGDVPALLSGAGNRMLRASYDTYSGGLLRYCGRVRTRDFRDVKAIQVEGDALQEVPEGGPYPRGAVRASAESYSIGTFGRIHEVSRTALLEDDLLGFQGLVGQCGRAAAEFAAAKVAAILESNPTLSDGAAAFSAGHGNLGTSGALSETTLGEALKLMRGQVGLGGGRISVVPAALVVPGALEFTARKLVTLMGNPPPIQVAVEPRLASATAFYVVSDPALLPAITYFDVAGSNGPAIEIGRRPGFLGLQLKVSLDFGAGFVEHRGAVKNAGV